MELLNVDVKMNTVTAEQVLLDKVTAGDNVVVVGGGLVGCETVLWLAQQGEESFKIDADTLITSVGYLANNALYEEIKDINVPVYNIGDSNKVHNIMYAIWDAYELGRNIQDDDKELLH